MTTQTYGPYKVKWSERPNRWLEWKAWVKDADGITHYAAGTSDMAALVHLRARVKHRVVTDDHALTRAVTVALRSLQYSPDNDDKGRA